jgi:hypothetical protein
MTSETIGSSASAPGKYYLTVSPSQGPQTFAVDRSVVAGPEEDYVPTYYLRGIDPAAARF